MFPGLDPIPLPAPVWLMKGLLLVTLALHFIAVQLLVGGLLASSVWSILGRSRGDQVLKDAAGAVSYRLPVVMTYVINLGVPPLLFTQVLYGRALYTSTVLIGAWWIAVIGLLMLSYTCLYAMTSRAASGKAWGWIGLVALLVVVKIGYIYSTNFTLMLRPEAWVEMYRSAPSGTQMNGSDPTVLPRLAFMMLGGLTVSGAGMMLLGLKRTLSAEAGELLRRQGGRIAAAGALAQAGCAFWVMGVQPEGVAEGIAGSMLWRAAEIGWIATAALVAVAGIAGQAKAKSAAWMLPAATALFAFLNVACTVLVRDGIRDVTLLAKGFDVWERSVASNWIVIGAFLLLFVLGLVVVGWLASVVVRARREEERYA